MTPEFAGYPTMLIKLLNETINNPQDYKIDLQLNKDNSADVIFSQKMSYKNLQLLSCAFLPGEEETVKKHIKYRHRMANLELQQMMEKLETICTSLSEKNPSLIKHICREVQKERPWGDPLDQQAIANARKNTGARS